MKPNESILKFEVIGLSEKDNAKIKEAIERKVLEQLQKMPKPAKPKGFTPEEA